MESSTGVLVGCDASQEWLLAWFYAHFRKYNPDCPLAFADFGMSDSGRAWCAERGLVYQVPLVSAPERPGVLFQGDLWQERNLNVASFGLERWINLSKPFAIAQSPFERTLWLDLDCEVRGDLAPLLAASLAADGVAAVACRSYCQIHNLSKNLMVLVDKYNGGVILTEKRSAFLNNWVSLSKGGIGFRTEEASLAFLLHRMQMQITELPHLYNWPVHNWGENEDALIYHWMGKAAKIRLRAALARTSVRSLEAGESEDANRKV